MRVLIACDKFKGSLTAPEACSAVRKGLIRSGAFSEQDVQSLPVADGGDGIAETLTIALSGELQTVRVHNALGKEVSARFGLIENGRVAVIEMAEASGLAQLGTGLLQPLEANTFGTGELITAAMARGVEKILFGIGGSATNDAGVGMAQALGWKFFEESGSPLTKLPEDLSKLYRVTPPPDQTLPEVVVACDVANPLLGENGCTRVYGPQKGIREDEFEVHERGLENLVRVMEAGTVATLPGAGAAGGLGFGAIVFLKATLTPGFELIADVLGLQEEIEKADLVITAEGRLDLQSLEGKAPFGVASLAKKKGKRVVTFCGIREGKNLEDHFGKIIEIRDPTLTTEQNMVRGAAALVKASKALGKTLPH